MHAAFLQVIVLNNYSKIRLTLKILSELSQKYNYSIATCFDQVPNAKPDAMSNFEKWCIHLSRSLFLYLKVISKCNNNSLAICFVRGNF